MYEIVEIKLENNRFKNWKKVTLGEILKVKSGDGLTAHQMKAGGDYAVYGGNGINGYYDKYIVEEPTLIIGRVGAKCGVVHITKPKSWVTDNALIVSFDKKRVDQKFLYWTLVISNLNKLSVSTAQPVVSGAKIYSVEVLLPPLPEQHRIVAKIEELFSELDYAITTLKTTQQQLQTYRQAVLKHAFEGFFSRDIKKWKESDIFQIAEKIQIGPFGSQLHQHDYVSNEVPLVNPTHIKNGKIVADVDFTITASKKDSLPNYILNEGDVIMGRRGEMGRCALVTKKEEGWFCGTGSLYIRPDRLQVDSNYLFYYLSSRKIKEHLETVGAGTTMTNLNLKIIKSIPFLKPPLEEQKRIVSEIETRLSESDYLLATINEQLKQAESLRQSILQRAFSGEL